VGKPWLCQALLIARILDCHDVMNVTGDDIFAHWKNVVAQVQHNDILMLRMFDE